MISQAILADAIARDPHNWLLHTDLAVGGKRLLPAAERGSGRDGRLHLAAGAATGAALSPCAAAPSLQTSSSNAILSAASLHLHCSPL